MSLGFTKQIHSEPYVVTAMQERTTPFVIIVKLCFNQIHAWEEDFQGCFTFAIVGSSPGIVTSQIVVLCPVGFAEIETILIGFRLVPATPLESDT